MEDIKWTGRDTAGVSYGQYRTITLNRRPPDHPGGTGYYVIGDGLGGLSGHFETEDDAKLAINKMREA